MLSSQYRASQRSVFVKDMFKLYLKYTLDAARTILFLHGGSGKHSHVSEQENKRRISKK